MMLTTYLYHNRLLLVLTLFTVAVAGISAYLGLPRLEDPRISNRNPLIITTLPGATAERVEALVTKTIETALRDLSEIKTIESTSSANISSIRLELDDLIYDTEAVFTKIRDKIADIQNELPPEASLPELDDQRGAVAFTVLLGVQWAGEDAANHLNLINRTSEELADRLRNVSGTDLVRIYGQPQEEITIELDRNRIAELGLPPTAIAARIASADSKVAAGTFRSAASNLVIEVAGAFESIERIRQIPLMNGANGEVVRVADVAKVHRNWQDPPEEIAYANRKRAIFVAARMQDNQQFGLWMKSVDQTLANFGAIVSDRVRIERVFEQQKYTRQRLGELGWNLILGSLVVVLVVFFMMGWRNALLVGIALPLVSALVLFSLQLLGIPLHQMSIFGLIVAIGLLIDNAIVVVDDVTYHLREGRTPTQAIDHTVRHLFIPLLGSTITTVLSFLPILLLPGNVGEFVGTIATTVILALVFSFLVSMTVIPALTGMFANTNTDANTTWWRAGIQSQYFADRVNDFLRIAVSYPAFGILIAISLPLIGFLRVSELRNQFFPGADRNQFQVQVWNPPQSSVAFTAETAQQIETRIRKLGRIERIDWLVGGSMPTVYYNLVMNQDNKPNYAQAIVTTEESSEIRLIETLQRDLDQQYPNSQIVVRQLAQGPPIEAPVEVRLFGPSVATLRQLGSQLQRVLYETPGVIHTRTTFDTSRSKVNLIPDEAEAQLAGLSLNEIAAQLQTALEGTTGGVLLESTEQLPVRVRLANEVRGELSEIASSRIRAGINSGAQASWMPLESVAQLQLVPEVSAIPRRNGERCNTIQAFVVASALPPEVTDQFLKQLEQSDFEIPTGYRLQVGGDKEELRQSMASLFAYAPILAVLIFATLILSFRSFILAGVIGAVAALSAGIGFFSIWVAGYPLGFNPLIGMAGLIGLAINDSIVVLTQIRSNPHARNSDIDSIVSEVMKTGRHVLSTTLTTIGGFLPLLLGGGTFWPPLAVVIAGGVGGATILATVFVPVAYRVVAPIVDGSPNSDTSATRLRRPLAEAAYREKCLSTAASNGSMDIS